MWHVILFQFLRKFEDEIIQREYPALSRDRADQTIEEPLSLASLKAVMKVMCGSSWRHVTDKQSVSSYEILDVKLRIFLFRYQKQLWIIL